ncbi:MAG TPA: hypothetical protein VFU34_04225 [Gaiellaceae bacterium]|nr:hypothetical protein [Gaiellaceae bacterium]
MTVLFADFVGSTHVREPRIPNASVLSSGTTVEPFALRAAAVARRDDELLVRADERFAAPGLEWHRAQLERLLAGSQ